MRLDLPVVRHLLGLVQARAAESHDSATDVQPSGKALRAAARAERLAAKERAVVERERKREEKAAQHEAELRARDELSARAFVHYQRVREWARSLPANAAGTSFRPGADPAAALAPLWDATPETIADLRRWCEPLSGVMTSDYEPPSPDLTRQLQSEWMALRSHRGSELFVQEPASLGGFGILRYGQRVNAETLRWFAASIGLQDGGVLGQFQNSLRRQLVWEIGGGWGGYAYAFKTLCPNVTYVITGTPATLLVAGVYLQTVFPKARFRFVAPGAEQPWDDWSSLDFVLAQEGALPAPPAPIDLTLDIMTLRNRTEDGVRAHVRQAYDHGTRYFYSLLPSVQAPDDARRVWDEIGRLFWLHPVPPRGMDGIEFPPPAAPDGYVHVVGWRRMFA